MEIIAIHPILTTIGIVLSLFGGFATGALCWASGAASQEELELELAAQHTD